MENITKFKKLRYYGSDGKELTKEEIKKTLGIEEDEYMSSDECAYQCAYDMSNDWAKETPDWNDVQEAYKKGVEDALKYAGVEGNELLKSMCKGTGIFKEN